MTSPANDTLHDTIFQLLCAFSGADPEDHEESVFEAEAADSLMSAIEAQHQQKLSQLAVRIMDLPTAGVIDSDGIRRERLDRDKVLALISRRGERRCMSRADIDDPFQDLPVPNQPEYMTWPLEKLQEEYRSSEFIRLAGAIRLAKLEHQMEVVQAFAELLRELQEGDR